MSNRLAVILGALIVATIALDLIMGWGGTVFALRKLADLIEWMAFWR